MKYGILLSNLGTPDAPTPTALRRYLAQFLSDHRVIDLNPWLWQPILHGIVLRTRPQRSAKLYAKIWQETGSPLLHTSRLQQEAIAKNLTAQLTANNGVQVALGMRYGSPSIAQALRSLQEAGCESLIVLPLYPQYAAATTASSFDAVFDELKQWRAIPKLHLIDNYHDHPDYIAALVQSIRELWQRDGEPERLLFSFHGIPKRYAQLGDPYPKQCYKTVELVVRQLKLNPARFIVTFQSRFGREVWLQPYTDVTLAAWAKNGVRHVDVICPGFSVDCLETLEEIEIQNRELFLDAGGQKFRYIPALNARTEHTNALSNLLRPYLA